MWAYCWNFMSVIATPLSCRWMQILIKRSNQFEMVSELVKKNHFSSSEFNSKIETTLGSLFSEGVVGERVADGIVGD